MLLVFDDQVPPVAVDQYVRDEKLFKPYVAWSVREIELEAQVAVE